MSNDKNLFEDFDFEDEGITKEEKNENIEEITEEDLTEESNTEDENNDEKDKDEMELLAEAFEEQAKTNKTKKGTKKETTSKTTTTGQKPATPKSLVGYKVVVYGDELFTVEDPKATEEDIRKTLEETYQYIEFSKNKTVIHVNEENKVITPHVKFQNKG